MRVGGESAGEPIADADRRESVAAAHECRCRRKILRSGADAQLTGKVESPAVGVATGDDAAERAARSGAQPGERESCRDAGRRRVAAPPTERRAGCLEPADLIEWA